MIEIKFKAWDIRTKTMDQVIELVFVQKHLYDVFTVRCHNDAPDEFHIESTVDRILLQYTGLKDDTGEEIYQSFIIELDSTEIGGEKLIGEVIRNDDQTLGILGWGLWTKRGYHQTDFLGRIKILGNIYQNPELLKEKTKE